MPIQADNLKQRAISGAFWYGSTRFAIQLLTWGITIVVARILSPSDYGLFGFALIVTGLVDLVNELGIGAAIIQRQDLKERDLDTIFWVSLAFSILVYTAMWFAAPFVAAFFKQPQLIPILRVIMLNFILGSLQLIPWNLLTKKIDFKRRSLVEVAANVTAAFVTLAMAYFGFGVWALVAGVLFRQITLSIGCFVIQPWRPRLRIYLSDVKSIYGFGLNISASRVIWYIYSNADFFIIGKLLGHQSLGIYSMTMQLVKMPVDRITSIINQVAYPVYSELQNQPERLKSYFLKINKLVSAVTFPMLAGMFLVADIAIPLLLTEKWIPLITPLKIMCWVGMVMSVSTLIGPTVTAKGRPDLALIFNMICVLVMPIGFYFGAIFLSGIEGVCWAWLMLYPILAITLFIVTRKLIEYEWHELFSAFRPAIFGTLAMIATVFIVRYLTSSLPTSIIKLTILIAIGGGTYFLMFFLAYKDNLSAIRQLLSLEKKPSIMLRI